MSYHVLYAGQTGTGKTQALIKSLKRFFEVMIKVEKKNPKLKYSTVILDPQSSEQSLAKSILPVLIGLGLWERVIYEPLASVEFVLAWQMLTPSNHPNPIQREKENEDSIHAFVSLPMPPEGCERHPYPAAHRGVAHSSFADVDVPAQSSFHSDGSRSAFSRHRQSSRRCSRSTGRTRTRAISIG